MKLQYVKKSRMNPRKKNLIHLWLSHHSSNLVNMYSLHFKIKVMFGHKLCYEIKVTFGEVSLKLCRMNWNVARNNVNVVDNELPSQITVYTS